MPLGRKERGVCYDQWLPVKSCVCGDGILVAKEEGLRCTQVAFNVELKNHHNAQQMCAWRWMKRNTFGWRGMSKCLPLPSHHRRLQPTQGVGMRQAHSPNVLLVASLVLFCGCVGFVCEPHSYRTEQNWRENRTEQRSQRIWFRGHRDIACMCMCKQSCHDPHGGVVQG